MSTAHERLTAALLQGGMPRLFVPGVLKLFDELVEEAVRRMEERHFGRRAEAKPEREKLTC